MRKFLLSTFAALCAAFTLQAQELQITEITPAAGSEVAGIAKGEFIKFKTNMDDQLKGVTYTYTDLTTGQQLYTTFSTSYAAARSQWEIKNYSNAVTDFKQGHTIEFKVEGYDEARPSSVKLGEAAITWTGAGSGEYEYSPVSLVSITPSETQEILSEEDNTFVLIFSDAVVLDQQKCRIIYAQQQSYPFQSITSSQEGKVWTLVISPDLLATCTPSVMFNVYAKDMQGRSLVGNEKGAYMQETSSYYKFRYDCLLGSPLLTVTPAAGKVTTLELFKLAYDGGMNYSYATQSPITLTDALGQELAAFTASDLTFGGGNKYVTFSLPQAITADGVYTLNVPSRFFALGTEFGGYTSQQQSVQYTIGNPLTITQVTPADGTAMAHMTESFTVTFSNDADITYGKWQVVNLSKAADADDRILTQGQLRKNNGIWGGKAYYVEALKMYAGSQYQLEIYPYHTEDDANYETSQYGGAITKLIAATWRGTSVAYQFSDTHLSSLTPSDGATITDGTITAVFSAPVESIVATINGGLLGEDNCTASPVDASKQTWNIVIPANVIDNATGSVSMNAWVKDANNRVVEGNVGENEESYFVWTFNCYNGCPVPSKITPASGSIVERIEVITIEEPAGINFSYSATSSVVVTKGKQTICQVPMSCFSFSGAGSKPTKATLTLPQVITAPGTYQILFPALYFIIGEETSSVVSRDFVVEYTIEGEETPGEDPEPSTEWWTSDPASGSYVSVLKRVLLTFPQAGIADFDYARTGEITLSNAAGQDANILIQTGYGDEFNQLILETTPITESGAYTFTIPAGVILTGASLDTGATDPSTEDLVLTLYVGEATGITVLSTDAQRVIRFNLAGQQTNASVGLIIIDGKKVIRK